MYSADDVRRDDALLMEICAEWDAMSGRASRHEAVEAAKRVIARTSVSVLPALALVNEAQRISKDALAVAEGALEAATPTMTDDAVREALYWAQESAKCRQCADYGYLIAPGAMLDVPENHVPCPTCNGKRDEYAHSQVATLTAALADRERLREEELMTDTCNEALDDDDLTLLDLIHGMMCKANLRDEQHGLDSEALYLNVEREVRAALADRERMREENERLTADMTAVFNERDGAERLLHDPAYVRVPMAVLEEEASRTDPDEDFDRGWIWGVCPEEAERTYGTTQKEA